MSAVQAVIMAGGEGSRLRPLTSNLPKPMLPVANKPLMEHIIELLKSHGTTDVVATVQFLSSVIRNYFGDGSDLGISLSYATEEMPLGTAGSVLAASELLEGTFLVISGDALTDIDLTAALEFHRSRDAAATLVLKRMQDPLEFGIVMTGEEGRIERFLEKPTWGQVFSDTINTGIYVLEPEVMDLIPPDQSYDFSSELFPLMLDKGLPLYGYITDSYWSDVGNAEAFLQAQQDALGGRAGVAIEGFELQPGVWVGEDVAIDPTARINGPAVIGDNCRIGGGARINSNTVIAPNCQIGEDAVLTRAVLLERAHIGSYARVRGGVVGRNSSLGRSAVLEEGAVLGDQVTVGADALIAARVKVYPGRTVEAGTIVNQSIVRERRATRSLFGSAGVSGPVNLGITPLTATRLGMAYGSSLKRGSVVVTGRDPSRAARTMKRALIAGLNATGIDCHDLELTPMPVARFTVQSEQAVGGINVRTSPGDPEGVEIRIFDGDGADLAPAAQRKIERIYFREDYRLVGPAQLGELEFPARALEQYVSALLGAVDLEAIRKLAPKVVVDYASGSSSLVGPSILGRLGCDVLAVNAFTDEHRPVLVREDLERLLSDLAKHVRVSGSSCGVLLEPGGEVAYLVDDKGRVVAQETALLAFIQHETDRGAEAVAVPVSSTAACERIAAAHGAKLLWTATGLPSLMAKAQRPEVGFAGNSDGALIFPGFMPAPDGLMTFCKTLELLAAAGQPLSKLVDGLPELHVVRREVRTPWAHKGAVMRRIASEAGPGRLILLDGIKVVEKDRWVLVIPFPDDPLCGIWAEAPTKQQAEELADRYAGLVERAAAHTGDAGDIP